MSVSGKNFHKTKSDDVEINPNTFDLTLYESIEHSITECIGELEVEIFENIIKNILFHTNNKTISIKFLRNIVEKFFKNQNKGICNGANERTNIPEKILNFIRVVFFTSGLKNNNTDDLKKKYYTYRTFNLKLLTTNALNILSYKVIHKIEDETKINEKTSNFDSMYLILFFLVFTNADPVKKSEILFDLMNYEFKDELLSTSNSYNLILRKLIFIQLFFSDAYSNYHVLTEYDKTLKLKVDNVESLTNEDDKDLKNLKLFLSSAINYKKALFFFKETKSVLKDFVYFISHSQIFYEKKSIQKISKTKFLELLKNKNYKIFSPTFIKRSMMKFIQHNLKKFDYFVKQFPIITKGFIIKEFNKLGDTDTVKQIINDAKEDFQKLKKIIGDLPILSFINKMDSKLNEKFELEHYTKLQRKNSTVKRMSINLSVKNASEGSRRHSVVGQLCMKLNVISEDEEKYDNQVNSDGGGPLSNKWNRRKSDAAVKSISKNKLKQIKEASYLKNSDKDLDAIEEHSEVQSNYSKNEKDDIVKQTENELKAHALKNYHNENSRKTQELMNVAVSSSKIDLSEKYQNTLKDSNIKKQINKENNPVTVNPDLRNEKHNNSEYMNNNRMTANYNSISRINIMQYNSNSEDINVLDDYDSYDNDTFDLGKSNFLDEKSRISALKTIGKVLVNDKNKFNLNDDKMNKNKVNSDKTNNNEFNDVFFQDNYEIKVSDKIDSFKKEKVSREIKQLCVTGDISLSRDCDDMNIFHRRKLNEENDADEMKVRNRNKIKNKNETVQPFINNEDLILNPNQSDNNQKLDKKSLNNNNDLNNLECENVDNLDKSILSQSSKVSNKSKHQSLSKKSYKNDYENEKIPNGIDNSKKTIQDGSIKSERKNEHEIVNTPMENEEILQDQSVKSTKEKKQDDNFITPMDDDNISEHKSVKSFISESRKRDGILNTQMDDGKKMQDKTLESIKSEDKKQDEVLNTLVDDENKSVKSFISESRKPHEIVSTPIVDDIKSEHKSVKSERIAEQNVNTQIDEDKKLENQTQKSIHSESRKPAEIVNISVDKMIKPQDQSVKSDCEKPNEKLNTYIDDDKNVQNESKKSVKSSKSVNSIKSIKSVSKKLEENLNIHNNEENKMEDKSVKSIKSESRKPDENLNTPVDQVKILQDTPVGEEKIIDDQSLIPAKSVKYTSDGQVKILHDTPVGEDIIIYNQSVITTKSVKSIKSESRKPDENLNNTNNKEKIIHDHSARSIKSVRSIKSIIAESRKADENLNNPTKEEKIINDQSVRSTKSVKSEFRKPDENLNIPIREVQTKHNQSIKPKSKKTENNLNIGFVDEKNSKQIEKAQEIESESSRQLQELINNHEIPNSKNVSKEHQPQIQESIDKKSIDRHTSLSKDGNKKMAYISEESDIKENKSGNKKIGNISEASEIKENRDTSGRLKPGVKSLEDFSRIENFTPDVFTSDGEYSLLNIFDRRKQEGDKISTKKKQIKDSEEVIDKKKTSNSIKEDILENEENLKKNKSKIIINDSASYAKSRRSKIMNPKKMESITIEINYEETFKKYFLNFENSTKLNIAKEKVELYNKNFRLNRIKTQSINLKLCKKEELFDILDEKVSPNVINVYLWILNNYNMFLTSHGLLSANVKFLDIDFFKILQDNYISDKDFTNVLNEYSDILFDNNGEFFINSKNPNIKFYRLIMPIYLENPITGHKNMFLAKFDFSSKKIIMFDASDILFKDQSISKFFILIFTQRTFFAFLIENKIVEKQYSNWTIEVDLDCTCYREEDYPIITLLYVAERCCKEESIEFSGDIDYEQMKENIFLQVSELHLKIHE